MKHLNQYFKALAAVLKQLAVGIASAAPLAKLIACADAATYFKFKTLIQALQQIAVIGPLTST
jgi:hypothetical protein